MAERYLRVKRVPVNDCISTIAAHFGPEASLWMNFYEQRHPYSTWESFVTAFLEHYGADNTNDYKAKLSHLQMKDSVDDFIIEFTCLSCRAPDWSDSQLIPIFCGGLRPDIQADVLIGEPRSLAHAQRLARLNEAKYKDRASFYKSQRGSTWQGTQRPFNPPYRSCSSTPPTNNQNQTLQPPNSNIVSTNRQQPPMPFRKFNNTEQRDQRERNLCYTCDEPYSKYHVCKKPFNAIIESPDPQNDSEPDPSQVEDTIVDNDHSEPTTLPLQAITNSRFGELMRVHGSIQGTPIMVFIDCGSAMNFLNPSLAKKLGLNVEPVNKLQFRSASDHILKPTGTATDVTIEIQSYTLKSDFLLLPVTGCDLVLGAEWLDSLGMIGWHFREKVMMFQADGKSHVLWGISKKRAVADTQVFMSMLETN